MQYLIISLVALLVSGLTFFSGFGLGTMLMPAFALFFPLPVAVAATAIVHLANNLFKFTLIGNKAKWSVVLLFGIPATIMAVIGATLLNIIDHLPLLTTYTLGTQTYQITWLKLIIAFVIIFFALFTLIPRLRDLTFDKKLLPLGGALSGFFGGLSGHQGTFRSAFLIRAGLEKEQFIATGVVISVIVDIARLIVYGLTFYTAKFSAIASNLWSLVIVASLAAFLGAFLGRQLLKKVTHKTVQLIVGILLILVALLLALGFI